MKTLYGEYRKTLLSLLLSSSPLIVLIAILIAMCLYHEPQWEKDRKAARLALSGITSRHFDLLPDEVKKDPVALSKRINAFIHCCPR